MHNQAVGAGADMLATALTPAGDREAVTFRFQVLCSGAGVYSVTLIRAAVTVVGTALGGAVIAANDWQQFDVHVHSGDSVNIRHSVGGNVTLRVREIYGGVE